MKFKYLDHTSEAKFQAFGKSLEEAFANSGLAMTNLMTEVSKVHEVKRKHIEIRSNSLKALLFDFLDEIIYLVDVDNIFIAKFTDIKIEKGEIFVLRATA
ncbi:archease, partial [Nanoarchaeota archaeon]